MRVFDRVTSEITKEGILDLVRWEQYGIDHELPFGAMWYTVPANSSSPVDKHFETELSVVLNGEASVEAAGRVTAIPQGGAFLLNGDEPHVIHNRSDEPLLIFSAYWAPLASHGGAGAASASHNGTEA